MDEKNFTEAVETVVETTEDGGVTALCVTCLTLATIGTAFVISKGIEYGKKGLNMLKEKRNSKVSIATEEPGDVEESFEDDFEEV